MARTRVIAPGFFTDADLFDAEAASGLPLMLAYAGLWCQADREGRFVWQPRELKLQVLPYHDVDFEAVLVALAKAGFVVRYVVNDKHYGYIPNFLKYQKPHKHEAPSRLPSPEDSTTMVVESPPLSVERQTEGYYQGLVSPVSVSTSVSVSSSGSTSGSGSAPSARKTRTLERERPPVLAEPTAEERARAKALAAEFREGA